MEGGRVRDVRLEHSRKAQEPMYVMLSGSVRDARLEHPSKTLSSNPITDDGIVIDSNSKQQKKAPPHTTSTPAWISTSVTLRGALFPSSPL